jgi:RNase P/RNase MRP subunit POP5
MLFVLVETKPRIEDTRELETIIRSSLKFLFGETEPHGCFLEVIEARSSSNHAMYIVKCPASSLPHIRAALTCCTPPPYLRSTHYRFDVLQVHSDLKVLQQLLQR